MPKYGYLQKCYSDAFRKGCNEVRAKTLLYFIIKILIYMSIPKNIFQTHKSIAYIRSKPTIFNAVRSWTRYSSEFNYHFFSDEQCEIFMRDKIGGIVYDAYKRLPMAVMKADLWRYCIIYYYGGIYADTDTVCMVNPNIFLNNEALLVCSPEQNCPYFCQWTFAAPPRSPILLKIINMSAKRILTIEKIKGEHIIHYLTGPAVFTDGIEDYLRENNHTTHENKRDYFRKYAFLAIFNADKFHTQMIKHLFAGDDGWKKERHQKLM